METPKLQTERLLLRKVQSDDVDAIFNCWMQDEEVSKYMCWKASDDINKAKAFVEFELGNIENDNWNRWILVLKDTSEVIGTCLIFWNDEEEKWDISYNLGRKFWGSGYITEAMQEVMRYAKETLQIKECIAVHAVENPSSGNVIKKLGFTYIKDVPYACNGGEIQTTGKYYLYQC